MKNMGKKRNVSYEPPPLEEVTIHVPEGLMDYLREYTDRPREWVEETVTDCIRLMFDAETRECERANVYFKRGRLLFRFPKRFQFPGEYDDDE